MQRLKTRAQFQAVMAAGTVSRTAHFALHRAALDALASPAGLNNATVPRLPVATDVWMGALVPKRWARRAVTRNTIKRQIYTLSATLNSSLPIAAHVVRLRTGFDRAGFVSASSEALKCAVRTELQALFANAPEMKPASTALWDRS